MTKCRYAKSCLNYREDSFTCNSDYTAQDDCGIFKQRRQGDIDK